jgi:hypothetical protein
MSSKNTSRRKFLKNTTIATAATALLPDLLFAKNSFLRSSVSRPLEKVNLACIGIGNRGQQIIEEFAKTGMVNIVALCDVDMGAPQTQKIMAQFPQA